MNIIENICLRAEVKRGTTRPEHFAHIKALRVKEQAKRKAKSVGNILIILCGLLLLWVALSFVCWQFGLGGSWNFFECLLAAYDKFGGA